MSRLFPSGDNKTTPAPEKRWSREAPQHIALEREILESPPDEHKEKRQEYGHEGFSLECPVSILPPPVGLFIGLVLRLAVVHNDEIIPCLLDGLTDVRRSDDLWVIIHLSRIGSQTDIAV